MPELRSETMTINMGPQHPSTHGVFRLVLEIDGEVIVSAKSTITAIFRPSRIRRCR